MTRRRLPDWVFKAIFGIAVTAFTISLGHWLIEALRTGTYMTRGGVVVSAASNPTRFGSNIFGTFLAMMAMGIASLATLGWIPSIGRRYKHWLRRLVRKPPAS